MLALKNREKWVILSFWCSLLCIAFAYLLFEYLLIPYEAISADEFVFARHIYDYTLQLPYRDFAPYKTVLGYYLLSIPLFFSQDLLAPLFYIKNEIALLNFIFLIISAYWLTYFFDKRAVLCSLLAILANQLFLTYSVDLRVDMLTAWVCLFSILALLQHRFHLAGFLSGIAFLISQKALWYIVAINGAMSICYFFLASQQFNKRAIFYYNFNLILPILIYIAAWSYFSSFTIVMNNLFYEAYLQAGIQLYMSIYLLCWQVVLSHGFLLFLYWPLTFIPLFDKHVDPLISERRVFVISLASIALLLFIHYKQAFPYNFVFTVPAFYLLYSEFFTWLFTRPYQFKEVLIMLLWLSIGITYPLYQSILISMQLDGRYQQTMLQLTDIILQNDGEYISGIPFLFQKDQSIAGMKNLIEPSLAYLFRPDAELKSLLLPSLYLEATNTDKILSDFKKNPIKIILNNYRMRALPEKIRFYIQKNYYHFYGSIYLYAPEVSAGKKNINIKFNGNYKLQSVFAIQINHKTLQPNKVIYLKQGRYLSTSKDTYRLLYVPKLATKLDPAYQQDEWLRMIKAIVS